MVKSKRLLIALIIILALTIPRYLFVEVTESEKVVIDENNMPDNENDMPDWKALPVLVCNKCYDELDELQRLRKHPDEPGKKTFYFPSYDPVDARCPVHPEISLIRITDFDWSPEQEYEGKENKFSVPKNLIGLYMPLLQQLASKKETYEAGNWFICRECQKQISDRIKMLSENNKTDELKSFAEKLIKLQPLESMPGKIAYNLYEIEDFFCKFHPDTKLYLTKKEPVAAVVKYTLPLDTTYISRRYQNKHTGQLLSLSIVTAGKDRRSIHRPERCIQTQGYLMKDRRPIAIKLDNSNHKSIRVMRLKMESTQIDPKTGEKRSNKMIVFYWFMSINRITESNLRLMGYWAWDRLILGLNYRWSYVLLTAYTRGDDPAEEERVTNEMYKFVQQFFPLIDKK